MVKMSVDFPNEAALCQRFLSARAQSGFAARGSRGSLCCAQMGLVLPPLADPRAPSVVSKRNELTLGDERVNLRTERRCFCGSKVIVDDEPAAVIQQVAVAIQISADVIVRVENEQTHVAAA